MRGNASEYFEILELKYIYMTSCGSHPINAIHKAIQILCVG